MELEIKKPLIELTIEEASNLLASKKITAVALAEAYLGQIKKVDGEIHAYLEVFDDVLEQAKKADERILRGEGTRLTGIPMAIKDVILINERKVSAGSKILEGYRATYDATVIKKLKEEGVVFLGRTNMDEFAMGSSTENSAYGVTKNPLDMSRVPGGSSGGSAAAVAMKGAVASLGTDTGGSIRQPASFCGLVGLKPTYGAVSRNGLIAYGSSLDQIGPMTKTVSDAEIIFDAIKGHDPMDSTSLPDEPKKDLPTEFTVGVPRHFLEQGIDPDVLLNFNESVEKLKNLGIKIKEVTLPNINYSLATYYIIAPAEASSNLSRFDGVRYGLHVEGENLLGDYLESKGAGFGAEVRRRIVLGTYILSHGYYDAYYTKANKVRNILRKDFGDAFKEVDAIVMPVSPVPAFKIGEKSNDPLSMYLADIFTVTANLVGVPAMSVPSGTTLRDNSELPLSIQFIAPHRREDILFALGKKFEKK
jgi:aspartyl-tRNA(Asn)/glutamyl-tRNA(Gln) amidotransferase subunit A